MNEINDLRGKSFHQLYEITDDLTKQEEINIKLLKYIDILEEQVITLNATLKEMMGIHETNTPKDEYWWILYDYSTDPNNVTFYLLECEHKGVLSYIAEDTTRGWIFIYANETVMKLVARKTAGKYKRKEDM